MVIIMLKKLNLDQIRHIHNTYMTEDFPADELKPLSSIERMLTAGVYSCYALYDGEELLAYAYLVEYKGYVLVDYFAVSKKRRGEGIGTRVISLLKELLAGKTILIECEDVAFSNDGAEENIRKRRIAFYEKAGFTLSGVKTKLFDVRYVILSYPEVDNVDKAVGRVYSVMLSKEHYNKDFEIYNK